MDGLAKTLIWAIEQYAIAQYCTGIPVAQRAISLITLFTADYFHTLPTEMNFLWPSSWTAVKVVFFICRYSPFANTALKTIFTFATLNPSTEVCFHILRANIWLSGIGQMSAQFLLVFRAYALLGRTRLCTILLSIFAMIIFATAVTCLASLDRRLSITRSPLPGLLPGCLMTSETSAEDGFAIAGITASIIYETILFLSICWAKVRRFRQDRNWLMRKIYNDALSYYLISLVASASGIGLWFTLSGPLRDLSSVVPRFLISIVSCRIILHIRKYGHEGHQTSDNTDGFDTVDMEESHAPMSRLRFGNSSRSCGADTEAELR